MSTCPLETSLQLARQTEGEVVDGESAADDPAAKRHKTNDSDDSDDSGDGAPSAMIQNQTRCFSVPSSRPGRMKNILMFVPASTGPKLRQEDVAIILRDEMP